MNTSFILTGRLLKRTLIVACCLVTPLFADEPVNPHEIDKHNPANDKTCLQCHTEPVPTGTPGDDRHSLPRMDDFVSDTITMCVTCHTESSVSHIVGVTPNYPVPADLPLNAKNQMTCLTCHYTHGSLQSVRPMASTSLMDQIFNRQRLSKSFVLRRSNANGQLCLACHRR